MRSKVLIAYLTLCVIWGTTWIVLKISLTGTPPILGVGLRFGISSIILWSIFLWRKESLILTPNAIKAYLAFGILNFGCSYSLTYWGTQFIYSGMSSVLWATLPIFIAIMAHFMIPGNRLNMKIILGGTIGLIGTFFIFRPQDGTSSNFQMIGVWAVLFAVVIAVWPNIFYKIHQSEIPHLHLNTVSQSISALILIPTSFLVENPQNMIWDFPNVSALLYLAVFGSVIAWSIFFWLFGHLTITQISTVALIPPVIALILGWVFLNETLTPLMIAGSALVLGGVFLINSTQKTPSGTTI